MSIQNRVKNTRCQKHKRDKDKLATRHGKNRLNREEGIIGHM